MEFLPENFYHWDCTASLADLREKKYAIAKAITWDNDADALVCLVGNGYTAYIPRDELCIENLKYDANNTCPKQARRLIGANVIAKIKEIQDDIVFLSRRSLQEKAFDGINVGDKLKGVITAIADFGIFIDAGAGITGLIYSNEIASAHLNHLNDLGFEMGDVIPITVLEKNNQNQLLLSYKRNFQVPNFKVGDHILAIIRYGKEQGEYYAEILPNAKALVESRKQLKYGQTVIIKITDIRPLNKNGDHIYKGVYVK